jgi:hypothetical protein
VDLELLGIHGLSLEDDTVEGWSLASLILSLCSVLSTLFSSPVATASESDP